jgi:hypothetical protein
MAAGGFTRPDQKDLEPVENMIRENHPVDPGWVGVTVPQCLDPHAVP